MRYLFLLVSLIGFSQSREKLEHVIQQTDLAALSELKAVVDAEFEARTQRIAEYMQLNPDFKPAFIDNGISYEVYDIIDGEPAFYQTLNLGAAVTARANRLYNGGPLGLNVQGQGMTAYVWDDGGARMTHQEFPNDKVINADGGTVMLHTTHVTGTIVAQGVSAPLRGIAFNADAQVYNWVNDYAEMITAAMQGMLVSNHSYVSGNTATWVFGAYGSGASQLDQMLFNAPFYLAVGAAGNDRNDFSHSIIGPHLANKGGFDLIRGKHTAKNILTVGAVNQVSNYTVPQSVTMSNFSSWGPTDDGRIKPDVVTKGTSVLSTSHVSNTASVSQDGTSMAAPGASGVALLLQQHHHNLFNSFMRAATLKGLILHTADEAGPAPGPDYMFGWGLINAERAATILTQRANGISVIQESVLSNGTTFTLPITAVGNQPLVASISWTDRAGLPNTGTVDPTNRNLVNDLDVRILRNGQTFFPWTLNPADPTEPAKRDRDNFRDNYEQIRIDNPEFGEYTLQVTHKGSLTGATQAFSVIVSGVNQTLSAQSISNADFKIYPNPSKGVFTVQLPNDIEVRNLEIYNTVGKVVFQQKLSSSREEIRTSNLPTGVYLVKISSSSGAVINKLVIQ